MTRFLVHYRDLLKWNKAINLTRITEPEAAAIELFLDSAMGLNILPDSGSILDIGSGAGFPGLVLASLSGLLKVTLLDSSRKRVEFLRNVSRSMKLENVEVIHGRWPENVISKPYDAVISRATFSNIEDFAPAYDMLGENGELILWTGKTNISEITGFEFSHMEYDLPGIRQSRAILIGRKKAKK